jgi:peptide/nickel transport system substrate-binding protein
VLYTQFKSGSVDLLGRQYITPDNYEEASKLRDRVVAKVPGPSVESIYLNLERPQFQELAVREALYAAIDKQSIIDSLYYGVPSATETYMPQQSFYYNPSLPAQKFDLARAKKLLDDAGWVPGRDGIRAKGGVRLAFTNSTTAGDHLREQVQQFLKQTLQQIGVEMTIRNLPAAVIWGDFWSQSQFDSVIVGITFLIGADPDVTNRFSSRAIAAKGGRGSNNAQYVNAEVDKLVDQGSTTFEPEARRAIYRRVQELVRADLPFLPLYQSTVVHGMKRGIQGYRPNPNTRTESWNAATWSWAR